MSPRDIREVRIVFDVSDDLSVKSADPEEGGEVARSSNIPPWTTTHGSDARGEAPQEEIRDRSPVERPTPPVAELWCRGPCKLSEVRHREGGGWPGFGLRFTARHNESSPGLDGKNLAPGTIALRNRPLRSDEPTSTIVFATPYVEFAGGTPAAATPPLIPKDPWHAFLLAEHEHAQLARRIYHLAQLESALSRLSNLLTRSDYVIHLDVYREFGEFVMDWGATEGTPWFIPFPE
jgi:hypothetical protein